MRYKLRNVPDRTDCFVRLVVRPGFRLTMLLVYF